MWASTVGAFISILSYRLVSASSALIGLAIIWRSGTAFAGSGLENERSTVNSSDKLYWRQFILLGIGMVAYTICRAGFPVGLAAMGKQFQWTAFEVGILSTIFLLGQAIIDIPAGYWADSLDRW
jgi:putative Mn2+ efflux pump MntP